jgi:hypothetical protein
MGSICPPMELPCEEKKTVSTIDESLKSSYLKIQLPMPMHNHNINQNTIRNSQNHHPPIRQHIPLLTLLHQHLEKVVHGAPHAHGWQLAVVVRHRTDAPELEQPSHQYNCQHRDAARRQVHTFSSIRANGPPPPSPFPNTSSASCDDSRFYECRDASGSCDGHESERISDLVVILSPEYVSSSCLGGVRVHYVSAFVSTRSGRVGGEEEAHLVSYGTLPVFRQSRPS